ncbi:isochorismatase family protein [Endozoicomonas sp. 8E]|uniref:isochorismatase family protein n=1 Tax=Endozoicomonas sp. 8E TaxID=3035692 RepID=UPI0029393874|nr:isochorismatase family protein [Endozoicomonas sp. 8E]WOG25866.1 isochorismatase family protein [Endozoicomonas sp. 8E]
MLSQNNTALVVVDVQGKLATLMYKQEKMHDALVKMIKGVRMLNMPVLWLEQLPEKLGRTTPEVADELEGVTPIAKATFSGCGHQTFMDSLMATGKTCILLSGIETHICVYQTALDLMASGYEVEIVADATSSRSKHSKRLALDKLARKGVEVTNVEMALFELMRTAESDVFRDLAKLVK